MSWPAISIIICTYKRYDLTKNCLAALRNQKGYPRSAYEILVVDNTPIADREAKNWEALGADRCIFVDTPGLSRARNKGIQESKSEYLIFIDDDAEASEEWLAHIINAFKKSPDALIVGGRVVPKYLGDRPDWISKKLEQYLSCVDWGEGVFPIDPKRQWIVGANMAFRRIVFDRYGIFDTALGRSGNATLLSNEETNLFEKIPKGKIYYSHFAEVKHLIPQSRMKREWFRKRAYWQAVSDLIAEKFAEDTNSPYFFEQFASRLPYVPVEYRNMRSLAYPCEDPKAFEEQLSMIYNLTVATGLGLADCRA